jgi:hypothetical protein
MNRFYFFFFILYINSTAVFSQNNCANPVLINSCPSSTLYNQSNAGMGDDCPNSCNISGEDVIYKILVPSGGADRIYVSILSSTGPLTMILVNTTCINSTCQSRQVPAGSSTSAFTVYNASTYYLWIDAATTINYGISISSTRTTIVNIPDTRGDFAFDSSGCASPMFNSAKPFFQVTYNHVYKTNPMTLSPLGVTGSMCITTFLKNTTGIEGAKKFEFTFNPLGYSSTNAMNVIPGNYLPGSWDATKVGNVWTYNFTANNGSPSGDFDGTPNACLSYTFCFDVIPISNTPALTSVHVTITGDGQGTVGYSGPLTTGCCPVLFGNCMPPPLPVVAATTMGFTFDDPGTSPLPIELVDFSARYFDKDVQLYWSTASETNNAFFTIERSADAEQWIELKSLEGAGNSTEFISYHSTDTKPIHGVSWYRLKQTDFDGNFKYSKIISVFDNEYPEIKIYPNPASKNLIIESTNDSELKWKICNMLGKEIPLPVIIISGKENVDISSLPSGIYFVYIIQEETIKKIEKLFIQN